MQKDSHEAYGTMPDQENAGTGKIPSKDGMNMCPLIIRAELFGPDPLYRPRGEAERLKGRAIHQFSLAFSELLLLQRRD
jgi:hypothetical protein